MLHSRKDNPAVFTHLRKGLEVWIWKAAFQMGFHLVDSKADGNTLVQGSQPPRGQDGSR